MNKKFIALLLVCMLALSACSMGVSTAKTTEVPAVTEAPVITPEPTPEITPEPTATPEPEGEYYSRLSDGAMEVFHAGKDYGRVLPYTNGEMYGLFDESGRLVTDPVYDRVTMLSYTDPVTAAPEQVGVWLLQQGENESIEDNELFTLSVAARFGCVTEDGSFALPCEYDEIYALSADCFIAIRVIVAGESVAWTVYRNDGTILFGSTDEPYESMQQPTTCYTVMLSGENRLMECLNGYYCFDSEGNILAGPYAYLSPMIAGHCIAQSADGTYRVLDESFECCLEETDGTVPGMLQGGYIVLYGSTYTTVLDSALNSVLTTQADYISPERYGFCLESFGEEESRYSFCDMNGTLLTDYNDGGWVPVIGTGLVYRSTGDMTEVASPADGTSVSIAGECTVEPFWVEGELAPVSLCVAYCWNEDMSGNTAYILDSKAQIISQGENVQYAVLCDPVTGDYYVTASFGENENTVIYNVTAEGPEGVSGEMYRSIAYADGMCLTEKDGMFTVRTAEGTLLLRYPLTAQS